MRRWPVLVLLLAMLLPLAAPVAQAKDEEPDLHISPSNPVAEGNYEGGALLLANPDAQTNSPAACRAAQHCDTIDLDVTTPEGYEHDFNFRITVKWPSGPDLDITLYNENERLVASAWTGNNPEIIAVPYADTGRYYITVLQFDDVLIGYNVKVEFIVREVVQPRRRSTVFTPSSGPSSGSGSGGGVDQPFGQGFGGLSGGTVFPVSDPSLQPVTLDFPEDETTKSIGFGPLDDDTVVRSSIKFDGRRLTLGVLSLAVIALLSYFLFFVPRKNPVRRPQPAA